MSVITLELDLWTFEGRATMRAYIDALEETLRREKAEKARVGASDVIPPEVWDNSQAARREWRFCKVCGATRTDIREDAFGERFWFAADLCSACALKGDTPEDLTVDEPRNGDPVGQTCHGRSHEAVATGSEPSAPAAASPHPSLRDGRTAEPMEQSRRVESQEAAPESPPGPVAASPDPEPCAPLAVAEDPDVSGAVTGMAAPEAVPTTVDRSALDPERAWTDDEKSEAWALHRAGVSNQDIAARLNRRKKQIYNFLYLVKTSKLVVPEVAAPGTALVAVAPQSGAIEFAGGGVRCVDPEMRAKWRGEMEEAERRKAVTKACFPAGR